MIKNSDQLGPWILDEKDIYESENFIDDNTLDELLDIFKCPICLDIIN